MQQDVHAACQPAALRAAAVPVLRVHLRGSKQGPALIAQQVRMAGHLAEPLGGRARLLPVRCRLCGSSLLQGLPRRAHL